jgi:hypothetical protein
LSDSLLGNQGLTYQQLCCTESAMECTRLDCQKVRKNSFLHIMNGESFLLLDISFRVRRPTL